MYFSHFYRKSSNKTRPSIIPEFLIIPSFCNILLHKNLKNQPFWPLKINEKYQNPRVLFEDLRDPILQCHYWSISVNLSISSEVHTWANNNKDSILGGDISTVPTQYKMPIINLTSSKLTSIPCGANSLSRSIVDNEG